MITNENNMTFFFFLSNSFIENLLLFIILDNIFILVNYNNRYLSYVEEKKYKNYCNFRDLAPHHLQKFILYFKLEQIFLDLTLVMDHMKITEKQFFISDSMKNVWEDQLLS